MKISNKISFKTDSGALISFENLIINSENRLEFRTSETFDDCGDFSYIFHRFRSNVTGKEIGKVEVVGNFREKRMFVPLPDEETKRVEKFRKEVVNNLVSLPNLILSGKERLICFPFKNEGETYLDYYITTETILKYRKYSPKYNDALMNAFALENLKKININKGIEFETFSDFQMELSDILTVLGLRPKDCLPEYTDEKVILITLKEIMKGVFKDDKGSSSSRSRLCAS